MSHKNNKIRQAAKGESCTLLLPGAGHHDPETVVWAHSPFLGDGKGLAQKSHDFIGCFACHRCHDILDGRARPDFDHEFLRARFNEAFKQSLIRLYEREVRLW